jgi:hypothetical protein
MKNVILVLAVLFATQTQAQKQFKDTRVVHGVTYRAAYNSPEKVMYIQQDHFDFTLAADSFSIQVMNETQWNAYVEFLVKEEDAFFRNGLYHLPNNEQVFNTKKEDEFLDGTYIYHLFGSVDTGQ